MMSVTALLVFVALLLALRYSQIAKYFRQSVRRDVPEPSEQPVTLFDVRRLLIEGDKEAAVELYCELFDVEENEALRHVEELERSLRIP